MPGTAAVYQDHARLWLSALAIETMGTVRLPDQSRALIDRVYGPQAEDVLPSGLQSRLLDAEGVAACARSLGSYRTINVASGYRASVGRWEDREEALTRLGEPTVTLRLARWDGRTLRPWAEDPDHAWRMSEVSVRYSSVAEEARFDDPCLKAAVAATKTTWPLKGKWHVLVPLTAHDAEWLGAAVRSDGRTVTITSSLRRGLEIS
jgi:CRISPR-associated endonuclease/helicase Cas3